MALERISLKNWKFNLGEEMICPEQAEEVSVPHTWNVEEGTEDYWGTGWYGYTFIPEEDWKNKRVQILFHAVYHDACVWLNGEEVVCHQNSGYTPFAAELTDYLKFGEENLLSVKADNRFSPDMLPYERSFDWANDGGLIRPVELLVTGGSFLTSPQVTARPVITVSDCRQDGGSAVFGLKAGINGSTSEQHTLEWELYEGCDGAETLKTEGCVVCRGSQAEISGRLLDSIRFWHFDSPSLYTLKLVLKAEGAVTDRQSIVFGFRDIHVRGSQIILNGEPVRLTGTEWMPGSDPACGMAEPKEALEKMLLCLKESNSILTRFHWQQDDWVYDWCDRHGMLVQEEVPFWGATPSVAGEQQWKIFKEQLQEMVSAHRNHPSVFAWGVGNELDGQAEETIQYIKDAVAYTHRMDPDRPANYVSNSIFKAPALDGTAHGDIMMVNDYIGTWHGDLDQYGEWDRIVAANPDKPVIPSEFGLCEPAFSGGDKRREEIFLEKLKCYRSYPNIAGTIYFCLNDYRTQMGEDGEGKWKKRVHGSAGLKGEPKPSYYAVQIEYAPVEVSVQEGEITLICRDTLPCYEVKGYRMRIGTQMLDIPDLKPGDRWCVPLKGIGAEERIEIFRPNGERVK